MLAVSRALERKLPMSVLLSNPTVELMAKAIDTLPLDENEENKVENDDDGTFEGLIDESVCFFYLFYSYRIMFFLIDIKGVA